ncbi:MAG: vitamin K epoxide reductase family protein [Akkermansiaceae bacterium]
MRIIRTLALIGFGISAYLFWMKLTGRISSVVGCGGEGGCANVLGSQWSQWFLVPVSAVSACFYLGVIALTFKVSKPLLTMAAFLLIAAALWFMGLQAFVIKSFCPWCFGTHSVGLLTAGAILWKASAPVKAPLVVIPLALMTVLALGQIYGPKPKTYEVTSEAGIEARKEVKVQNEGEGRLVTFKDPTGKIVKTYRLGSVPLIGSPDAKHFLVKYFDYTCASCRTMEEDLNALMMKHPGQVAVIVLPTPLNRECNPYLSAKIHDHKHACELARLGLAAWRAQPESFQEAHEILFQRPVHSGASARAELEEIIPAENLEEALKDPWIESSLKSSLEDYRALSSKRIEMPKLMVRGTKTMHGLAPSTEQFIKLIAKEFQLR